jgi:hypothetical protein
MHKRGTEMRVKSWFLVGVYAIVFAIEIGLGVNIGFVAHAMVSPAFTDMPQVSMAIAFVAGALIGFGSFGLFLKTEEAWEAIKVHAERRNEWFWLRASALILLNIIFVGIDILGMLYRLQFLDSRGVGFLAWIGVGLAIAPILIGLVVTPMHRKPADLIETEATEDFERAFVTEAYDALAHQPLDVRQLAFNGDMEGALTKALANRAASKNTLAGRVQGVLTGRKNNSTPLLSSPTVEADPVTESLDISKRATGPLTPALRK